MIKEFERIYKQLRFWGLARTQSEYSICWLGQCSSYFSSIKARGINPNHQAAMILIFKMRSHNVHLKATDMPRTNAALGQLSDMLEMEADCIENSLHDQNLKRLARK